jgi:hypothetical protein
MFFKDFGIWVAQPGDALQFSSAAEARAFIMAEQLADMAVRDWADVQSCDSFPLARAA